MARFTRALQKSRARVSLIRGLRFRLAAGFMIFFTLLLLGLGFLFRQMLVTIVDAQDTALLEEEWAASKGYLHIEHQQPVWWFDRADPEEALIVNRILGRVYLFADDQGNILQRSEQALDLGIDQRQLLRDRFQRLLKIREPQIEYRRSSDGVPFMIRSGIIPDKERRQYLLVVGRSVAASRTTVKQFTWRYMMIVPPMLLLCGILGWILSAKVLRPINDVAQTAQKITGANLNVQIPARGAGDELDHLIEAFNRMIERLNYSFEQIRQFSTDVSHELRTPLTAIRGQLEVALFTAETPEQYRDAMVNALQDVEQLSNIVRALLLLSQAESGQVALQLAPVNLAEVVRDIVDQFQIPAEEAQVALEAEATPDTILHADRTQMGRLISNLLSNAIKYTPAGGRIRVGIRQDDGMAQLWVEDNGIGIPAEKLPHIFDRFYRVRPSQSNPVQGLGLGLSFVAWIVNVHGGRIEVDSNDGKGTRFTVSLPIYTPPMPGLPADHPSPMPV